MKLTDHPYLREQILKRIEEIGWKDSEFIKDAEERGVKIEPTRWSKYRKNKSGGITDETLYWIAQRLCIDINIRFGKPVLKDGKINWVIEPYSELEALKRINKLKNG